MDNDRRSLSTLIWVPLLAMGGLVGYQYFAGPAPGAQGEHAEQTPDESSPSGAAPTQASATGTPALSAAERAARAERVTLEGPGFTAIVTNLGGGVESFRLTGSQYEGADGKGEELVTTSREEFLPLRLELAGVDIPADAIWDVTAKSSDAVDLRWTQGKITVHRRLSVGSGPYQLWSTVHVTNDGPKRAVRVKLTTHHYVPRDAEGGGFFTRPGPAVSHAMCAYGQDELVRMERSDALGAHGFGPDVQFAGVENEFFANVIAADGELAERC